MKPLQLQPDLPPDGGFQRTFGVEEEFLLVDPSTGLPVPVAEQALRHGMKSPGAATGPVLALEVKQEQLKAVGPACFTLQQMAEAIWQGRAMADFMSPQGRKGLRSCTVSAAGCPCSWH